MNRDKLTGRYLNKTRPEIVIFGAIAIFILGAYIVKAPHHELVQPAVATQMSPCEQITPGFHECASKESLARWNNEQQKPTAITFPGIITAYTSRVQETDSTPEIAANGENIWKLYQKHDNTCASNDYAFGTKLLVPTFGNCTVRDRMNSRYTGKGRIDFYYGYDTAGALQRGTQTLNVTILQ